MIGASSFGIGLVTFFADTGRFTLQVAQIVELGAPDIAAHDDFNLVDTRRVEREDSLDAVAVRNLANRKAGTEPAIEAFDADPLIDLDTLFVAFNNLNVNAKSIAALEDRDILAHLFHFEPFDSVHDFILLYADFRTNRFAPGACTGRVVV
jgi:hypothetical protein